MVPEVNTEMFKVTLSAHNCVAAVKKRILNIFLNVFYVCARKIDIDSATGPCLVIAPHPDDETLGCGAVIQRARNAGRLVHVVIVTDGSVSSHSGILPPQELAALRREEARNACGILGVEAGNIVFLPFADGKADLHIDGIASALLQRIKAIAPRQIFSPYGVDKGSDHRAVAAALERLAKSDSLFCPVYEYPIWFGPKDFLQHLLQPRHLSRLRRVSTRGCLKRKKMAMAAYRSQCENLTGEAGWWTLEQKFLARFFMPYELFFEKLLPQRQLKPART